MIYIASKTRHAGRWQSLRARGVPICSTWIDEAGPGQTKSMRHLWARITDEIRNCKVLLLYADSDDFETSPLKGAYIEAGMAIAFEKPVVVVLPGISLDSNMRPVGSWINHDRVRVYPHIAPALEVARGYCGGD